MSFDDALEVAIRRSRAVHARLVPTGLGPDDPSGRRASGVRDCGAAGGGTAETSGQSVHLRRHADPAPRRAGRPDHGQAAAERLRERYRVVLVDEFQDTDPIQWDILRRAFHHHTTLILIGDPKQAIYAFRGADVFSYLDAVQQATMSDSQRQLAQRPSPGGRPRPCSWVTPHSAMHESSSARSRPNSSTVGSRGARRRAHRGADPVAGHATRGRCREGTDRSQRIRPQIADDLVADITAVLGSGARLR